MAGHEGAHEQPVTGLAVGRHPHERATGALGGGKLGATQAQCCLPVCLQGTQMKAVELAAQLVDPLALVAGQQPAAGRVQRDL